MNYKVIMMSGEKYLVNKSEYQAIMKAEKGIFIPRLEVFINKSSISTAYPENRANEIKDRKQQQIGVLHDGTRVVRHFGEWIVAGEMTPDDNGKYQPVKLDPTYYPEITSDCVASPDEYQQIVCGVKSYYEFMKYTPPREKLSSGFTHILEKND